MKKIILLLIILSASLFHVQAQDSNDNFRLELSTRGMFTDYDQLKGDFGYAWDLSEELFPYSIHLSVFYPLRQRFELGVGIGYANRDIYTFVYYFRCFHCDYHWVPELGEYQYTRLRSIEIPIELRMKWFKNQKRINPYFSIGMTYGIPIKYNLVDDEWRAGFYGHQLSIGLTIGVGANITLAKNWAMVFGLGIVENKYLGKLKNDFISVDPIENNLDEWFVKIGVSRAF